MSNEPRLAGPWQMTVLQVLRGDQANQAVAAASKFNVPPATDSGYALVQIRAVNMGSRSFDLEPADFGVVGSSRFVFRFSDAVPPEPALDVSLKPGESADGWTVFEIPTPETGLVLIFDSLSISGSWARQSFALEPGAVLPGADSPASAVNDVGTSFSAPAAAGELVATENWTLVLLDTATAASIVDLFPENDLRTRNLASSPDDHLDSWVAIKVRVTNNRTGNVPSYLPATAFAPVDDAGDRLESVGFLTPPEPDLAGTWFPGAVRDGWVILRPKEGDVIGPVIRFLPFWTDLDPRFLTWNAGSNATPAPGSTVTVGSAVANLRDRPSTDSNVLTTLQPGTSLTVTGPAVSGSGHSWWPVTDPAIGDSGYIASDVLTEPTPP